MGKTYAERVKKRKKTTEKYDREEETQEQSHEKEEQQQEAEKQIEEEEDDDENGGSVDLEGIPLAPTQTNDRNKPGVIFILEKASLEVGKKGKVVQISTVLFLFLFTGIWVSVFG